MQEDPATTLRGSGEQSTMSNQMHVTGDADALERYVLNLMTANERSQWENHLRECAGCREIVRSELMIVQGVRRAGRDALKQRLRDRLYHSPGDRVGIPWVRIVSIAATIVLLVGIGIYGRWLYLRTPQEAGKSERVSAMAEKQDSPAPAPTSPLPHERAARIQSEEQPSPSSPSLSKNLSSNITRRPLATPAVEAAAPLKGEVAVNSQQLPAADVAGASSKPAATAAVALSTGSWAIAQVLQDETSKAKADAGGIAYSTSSQQLEQKRVSDDRRAFFKSASKKANEPSQMESLSRSDSVMPAVPQLHGGGLRDERKIILSFASRRSEEQSQTESLSLSDTTLPALIRQDSSSIVVTIFIAPSDSVSYAGRQFVHWISEDSLIIHAGVRKLGLRLPRTK